MRRLTLKRCLPSNRTAHYVTRRFHRRRCMLICMLPPLTKYGRRAIKTNRTTDHPGLSGLVAPLQNLPPGLPCLFAFSKECDRPTIAQKNDVRDLSLSWYQHKD